MELCTLALANVNIVLGVGWLKGSGRGSVRFQRYEDAFFNEDGVKQTIEVAVKRQMEDLASFNDRVSNFKSN